MTRCKRCGKDYNTKKLSYCPRCGAVGEDNLFSDNINSDKSITLINKKHKKGMSNVVRLIIWLALVAFLIFIAAYSRIEEENRANERREKKISSQQSEYGGYSNYYENENPENQQTNYIKN